jgi:hypothetical protein
LRILVVSIFCYSFVFLSCVVPVSMRDRLCSVTVHTKVLQSGGLVRFSNRTDGCRRLAGASLKQNGHCVRCIQSSSFPSYDGIHKS